MTAKRFTSSTYQNALSGVYDRKENLTVNECCNLLNQLNWENEQLKSENNMLKITIARNEAYIERINHKGEWSNTSDEEKEVIAYLQAYHQGDIKELKK